MALRPAHPFDVSLGVIELTRHICDVESVSGNETTLADRVEDTLRLAPHLDVVRHGNTVAARTKGTHETRVILAGHLDTVPVADNLPARVEQGWLWGRGSVDMKGGVASHLILAVELSEPAMELTWIFYDCEEVDSSRNGLGLLHEAHPDWLEGDFAVLGEPTEAGVEGGCNGTLRMVLRARGRQAHSARPWQGHNAIHDLAPALATLQAYQPQTRVVEGLEYRESLSAVGITGGVAGNVVPDLAELTVNFRFAPDRSVEHATSHLDALFPDYEREVSDASAGARPGLDQAVAQSLVQATGLPARAKYGWTDVARFSSLGIPAVNFGPGNPNLAHTPDERVSTAELLKSHEVLARWLSSR